MAERRKTRRRYDKDGDKGGDPLTKVQKSINHWLRRNVPTKKTKFMHSHVVEYFLGSKAIDALLNDSPWSKSKAKAGSEVVFEYREQCIGMLETLMCHNMFHRAKKIPVAEKERKKKKGEKEEEKKPEKQDKKDGKKEKEKEKKKRRIRLEMHMDQLFLDTNDAYVWLYDPTPWYYWLGGGAIVLGIIAICLFPLWPTEMRQGVYYLSVALAAFLVFIIALAVIKYIVFLILFVVTAGKLRFWIFPNLTEDVGFFESFWPVYEYTYTGRRKKDKDSDDESDDDDDDEDDEDDDKNEEGNDGDKEGSDTARDDKDGEGSDESGGSASKDFEIIDKK